MRRSLPVLALALPWLAGCDAERGAAAGAPAGAPPVIQETWLSPRDRTDNVDSPAVWHGPAGQHWLVSTAKSTDVLLVHDAATGTLLRRVGGTGTAPGRFDRPNGIAIAGDIAFVVERDNRRIQALGLPDFASVGMFGTGELRRPYGVALEPAGAGRYRMWVTDNYGATDVSSPPDHLLGERVRRFDVRVDTVARRVTATAVGAFGDTAGPGVLRVVESIAVDPAFDRLLVAEELEGESRIKVYTRDGRFTGQVIDRGLFPNQAEGIQLYACGDTAGYWVATDQDLVVSMFHVFQRGSLEHVGSFRGAVTRNTDGIALSQRSFGAFGHGAFYAVHDDRGVAAFSWGAIADALRLRKDCGRAGG